MSYVKQRYFFFILSTDIFIRNIDIFNWNTDIYNLNTGVSSILIWNRDISIYTEINSQGLP